MMLKLIYCVVFIGLVSCNPAPTPAETYKDQYCTDPRTMRKHAAYTEWADAYSCSRHRCQPGGRNLAIYTVGCKRVEAPESAIECEEVVEDTNMQFPYCCPRLRCLVVVRGEVWTRVLGQPWESLPAAPWSHMYKMKKPPPGDTSFLPKGPEQGPVYELAEPEGSGNREKVLRAATTAVPCNDAVPRAESQGPDIVIALSTNNDKEDSNERRHKRKKMALASGPDYDEEKEREVEVQELEDIPISFNKPLQQTSEEKMFINTLATEKPLYKPIKNHQTWTELPLSQWNIEGEENVRVKEEPAYIQPDFPGTEERPEKKEEKPSNLQALVDAIGTRMRDIENVVQRMSEKVQHSKPEDELSTEKRQEDVQKNDHFNKLKKKDPEGEDYQRFSSHAHSSKYLRTGEFTTEPPLFIEDSHMNGYYSDASNSVIRRNSPKEPAQIYMAPVETRRKSHTAEATDDEKKHKKHHKRKSRHNHKKHHAKEEKKKRFNKLTSAEGKNAVSLEDSSGVH